MKWEIINFRSASSWILPFTNWPLILGNVGVTLWSKAFLMKPMLDDVLCSFSDSIYSFKLGLFNTVSEASRNLRIRLFRGAAYKIFQENLWHKFSFKYFAGSDSLEVFSCSSNSSSILRLVSPMYVCSQTHTLSYMTRWMRTPTF